MRRPDASLTPSRPGRPHGSVRARPPAPRRARPGTIRARPGKLDPAQGERQDRSG
ncbi:protein of unassigned function [Methylobacterium oryzae CBMB20]|uniref:Protein of unassigned function n=1 Tax=Methylobacterium oryzae CBMB20 TaxID=693986 RepID=A0A089NRC4_9HYPH|nr:protein of unassigned function [Methylobacterium oryzae CBMB20]